jgi:heat shock protein HslJ
MKNVLFVFLIYCFSLTIIISCSSSDDGSKSTDSTTTDNDSTTDDNTTTDNYINCDTITTTDNDTTPPTFVSSTPVDYEHSVSITSNISVTFSETMDTSSVTDNTLDIVCYGTFQISSNIYETCLQLKYAPTGSNNDKTFTITPKNNLDNSTVYRVRLVSGIKDCDGNYFIGWNMASGFKTESLLEQVTSVTTPTNDNTPDYTFSSSTAGTITYGGSCSSITTSATSDNNTITFNSLSDGTYSNCTIRVTDNTGNASNTLTIDDFTVDTTAPVVAEVTKVTTPSNDTTPNYTFSSSEAGTITYGGSCSSNTTSATTGDNTITLNTLSDETYSNCTITVTDSLGHVSNTLTITSFIIDTTASSLAEVTAVTTPTNDTTPDYTFSSSESGTITYGGYCSSSTTSATSDNNTITFNSLSDGTYSNCTITVTDNSSNSITLNISSFVIDTTGPTVTFNPANGATDVAINVNITITSNEAVRNTDNSELTNSNVDSLITLKLTNASGDNVSFDATIDGDKKVITIDPTSNLPNSQAVYVSIGSTVEDSSDSPITAANATFTTVIETTAPTASLITSCGINSTQDAVVQSTETGTAYLVKTGGSGADITVSNLDSITDAENNMWNSVPITSASTNTNLSATGLASGTYRVYAVDSSGNLSSASINSLSVTYRDGSDTTAPTALLISCSYISCNGVPDTGFVAVQSSETGTAYLVHSSITVSNICSITGDAVNKWNSVDITSASSNTLLAITGLIDGTYRVYAVDSSGNLSGSSTGTGGKSGALGSLHVTLE